MKRIKKLLWVLLGLLTFVLVTLLVFYNLLKPSYNGQRQLPNLQSEVQVYFDPYGIPHIYANNEADAFRALGYVHAQDRLWQMELLRRIAKGGLSEVFGKDLINTDKFFLSLGIDEHTQTTLQDVNKDSETVQLANAYLDGVNEFIATGPKPLEFYLVGIEAQPFELEDIYNTLGYMAFSFAMAHKTDPLLTNIKNTLGAEYLDYLAIDSDTASTWIKNYRPDFADSVAIGVDLLDLSGLENLPIPQFIGSNSWVLGPEKTKSGQVILANDPHIGFSQPAVWYEAHIQTPAYEKYGYHIGGVPFPLLGHDRNLAYGLTMFENDDIDFYYEETNPENKDQYRTESGWKNYVTITKKIKVKDGEPVSFQYKKTRHGPLLNGIADQISGERPIAMSWKYTQDVNKVIDALYGMTHATDLETFEAALPKIHAPGLNIMYGDAKGNIAWWAAAQLYQMPDSLSTKFILDGSTGEQEPLGDLDFSENPQAINPPWHYVYSANNQPDSVAGRLYPGYYLPENRALRIVQLLESQDQWDVAATQEMIMDDTSPVYRAIVRVVLKDMDINDLNDEQIKFLDLLKKWEGNYDLESIEATFLHRWEYFVLKYSFEDEMGPERFQQFLSTHLVKRQIAEGAGRAEGLWWDDINTPDKVENRYDIALKAFVRAWESLESEFGADMSEWQWKKVHTLEHPHPFGAKEYLRKYFNVGPYPVRGSREVINNLAFPYDSTLNYRVNAGPSTRRIIDFSNIENSVSILPTGQSGNPLSKHYDDQAQMFVNGEFRKMMMNEEEIKRTSANLLTFRPKR